MGLNLRNPGVWKKLLSILLHRHPIRSISEASETWESQLWSSTLYPWVNIKKEKNSNFFLQIFLKVFFQISIFYFNDSKFVYILWTTRGHFSYSINSGLPTEDETVSIFLFFTISVFVSLKYLHSTIICYHFHIFISDIIKQLKIIFRFIYFLWIFKILQFWPSINLPSRYVSCLKNLGTTVQP